MADEQQEEQSLSKLAWGYVGVGVLWFALLVAGIALERLGLTSNILTSVLPGEVGELREQNAEYETNLKEVTQDRDVLSRRADTFQRQLEQEKNKVTDLQAELDQLKAATAPAQEAPAETPTEAPEA